jgi:hypothetical protein
MGAIAGAMPIPLQYTARVAHLCSRCLSEGHLVSSYSNSVCCLWCFGYGHKRGACFRRQHNMRSIWMVKGVMMNPAPAALESPADKIEETGELREIAPTDTTLPLPQSTPKKPIVSRTARPSPPFSYFAHHSSSHGQLCGGSRALHPTDDGVGGWGSLRRARREVYIRGGVAKTHEDCAIAVVNGELSAVAHHHILHDITNYIVAQHHLTIKFFALHPHGVGIYKMRNACQRDALIALNPHLVGNTEVTFYPHDEAPLNFRRMAFPRKCWIMLLGYPLDFKDATTLVEVCTSFARVLHWNSEDTSMARVFLRVLVEDLLEIPRDVVIKMGRESDGEGHSWTVPIYIFNSEVLMADP